MRLCNANLIRLIETLNWECKHKNYHWFLLMAENHYWPAIGSQNAAWVRKARFFARKILAVSCQICEALARQKQGKIFLQKPKGKRNKVKCRPCRLLRAYFCLSLDNRWKLPLPFPCFKKTPLLHWKWGRKRKKSINFLKR